MVPMLTCGLVRSNFAFATGVLLKDFLVRRAPDAQADWFSRRAGRTAGWPQSRCAVMQYLLARRLRDDLLRDVRRNLGVGVELHAVARPALGLRPQVADIAEHLRQRYQRLDDAGAAALFHRLDDAAPGVEVTDDVAHVVLRGDDLDGHHRFEERR